MKRLLGEEDLQMYYHGIVGWSIHSTATCAPTRILPVKCGRSLVRFALYASEPKLLNNGMVALQQTRTHVHTFIPYLMDTSQPEPSPLPWDTNTGNRFSHYSPVNHSATVWIATALALTYVLGVLLVRIFIKWRVLGWDDGLVIIGTVRDTTKLQIGL